MAKGAHAPFFAGVLCPGLRPEATVFDRGVVQGCPRGCVNATAPAQKPLRGVGEEDGSGGEQEPGADRGSEAPAGGEILLGGHQRR